MEFYTVKEIAEKLKISKNTIYLNPRKYGFFKMDGVWRITDIDFQKYIDSKKIKRNNVIQLNLVDTLNKKEDTQWRYFNEKKIKRGMSISQHPAVNELSALLAR